MRREWQTASRQKCVEGPAVRSRNPASPQLGSVVRCPSHIQPPLIGLFFSRPHRRSLDIPLRKGHFYRAQEHRLSPSHSGRPRSCSHRSPRESAYLLVPKQSPLPWRSRLAAFLAGCRVWICPSRVRSEPRCRDPRRIGRGDSIPLERLVPPFRMNSPVWPADSACKARHR
jgi:hypothetical protein